MVQDTWGPPGGPLPSSAEPGRRRLRRSCQRLWKSGRAWRSRGRSPPPGRRRRWEPPPRYPTPASSILRARDGPNAAGGILLGARGAVKAADREREAETWRGREGGEASARSGEDGGGSPRMAEAGTRWAGGPRRGLVGKERKSRGRRESGETPHDRDPLLQPGRQRRTQRDQAHSGAMGSQGPSCRARLTEGGWGGDGGLELEVDPQRARAERGERPGSQDGQRCCLEPPRVGNWGVPCTPWVWPSAKPPFLSHPG